MPNLFEPRHTALLVIDMQRDFLDPRGYAARAGLDVSRLRSVIDPIRELVSAARAADLLIVHTREGHLTDLSDCPAYKLERSHRAGAPIGSSGPLGRLLVRGEYGHDFIDELQPLSAETVIDKAGYSAFHGTDLALLLARRGITELLIAGITTEVCVSSTLRAAVELGYRCYTIADACASSLPDLHEAALRMIDVEGGIFGFVTDCRSVLDCLGTPVMQ